MSISFNKRRKAKRRAKTDEHRAILSDIRRGKFPRFFLAKEGEGSSRLQRKLDKRSRRKLTWKLSDTVKALLNLSKDAA